jgi:hypothetical protein
MPLFSKALADLDGSRSAGSGFRPCSSELGTELELLNLAVSLLQLAAAAAAAGSVLPLP